MEANEILVLAMFGSFILLLFTGVPVAWVLGGVGVIFAMVGYLADIYLDTFTGLDMTTLGLVVNRVYKIMDNWILVALPMFIFMGIMLDKSGVAERLMHAMQDMFGKVRGGLAITVVSIGVILAASTGIIGASVVLLAVMSLPAMQKQGYNMPLALGTIASAGTLGHFDPSQHYAGDHGGPARPVRWRPVHGRRIPRPDTWAPCTLSMCLWRGLFQSQATHHLPEERYRRLTGAYCGMWLFRAYFAYGTNFHICRLRLHLCMGIATPTEASGVGALGATLLALPTTAS
jgi:TRAP-type mannitol/chloroaromatic compound transport system permease large subunit